MTLTNFGFAFQNLQNRSYDKGKICTNTPHNTSSWICPVDFDGRMELGGDRVRVSRFLYHVLPPTASRLPYFCAPLPPNSHPSLCCSRLQVNQEDQKTGFNFQPVPKLDILVHFLAFVLAGIIGSR